MHNRVKVEITCNVQAEPRPDVRYDGGDRGCDGGGVVGGDGCDDDNKMNVLGCRWYKDTMLLDPSENKQMESLGSR